MQFIKFNKTFFTFLFGLSAIGFCCTYLIYSSRRSTKSQNSQKQLKSQGIQIHCKNFTKEECVGYLGRDVISAGYKPIKITIENNTDRNLKFSPSDISLKTVQADVVAKKVYYNTTGRATGWGIAGLIMPILWVPGIVHSASSYKANQKLSDNFSAKSATDRNIAPKSSIEGLIFVAIEDYKDTFDIILSDNNSQKKFFCTIDMNKFS